MSFGWVSFCFKYSSDVNIQLTFPKYSLDPSGVGLIWKQNRQEKNSKLVSSDPDMKNEHIQHMLKCDW